LDDNQTQDQLCFLFGAYRRVYRDSGSKACESEYLVGYTRSNVPGISGLTGGCCFVFVARRKIARILRNRKCQSNLKPGHIISQFQIHHERYNRTTIHICLKASAKVSCINAFTQGAINTIRDMMQVPSNSQRVSMSTGACS